MMDAQLFSAWYTIWYAIICCTAWVLCYNVHWVRQMAPKTPKNHIAHSQILGTKNHVEERIPYYYNCFTTLCPGPPRWVSTRRINHAGFCWSRHNGAAVASAEPYASYLHFAPEDNHASTSSVRFLRDRCPSWHPTNSIKALKVSRMDTLITS